jgi:hypothetical protein
MPEDWHSQDWLLVIEALTKYAGPTIDSPRQCRAWTLAEEIATREGLVLTETPRQIQYSWSGP